MCNLSKGVEGKGIAVGMERGMEAFRGIAEDGTENIANRDTLCFN